MDVPRKKSIGDIRLKKFEERFTLLGNFHASECPSKKEEKMLGNHLECPRTYLGTVGIDKSR